MPKWNEDDRIFVNGELAGTDWEDVRVSSGATILEVREDGLFVSIDLVDGDAGVCVTVPFDICEVEIEITVTQQHNGTLLSTVHNDQYYKRLYMDYTLDEAKEDFREYVQEEDAKIIREVRE